jgi:uncharacterized protein YutD
MIEALKAQVIEVCKYIWDNYEHELRGSGNVLYTWQYDVRWAAQQLREDGFLKRIDGSRAKFWEIA